MTADEFALNLQRKMNALDEDNKPFEIGVLSVIQELIPRIFESGIATYESRIGSYNSTNPLYVNTNLNAPIKAPPKGKNGEAKFKNGKTKKTTYFESYKDFRSKQGRESSFVNLDLTGELQRDIAKGTGGIDIDSFRFDNNEYRITVDKDINVKKVEGMEAKYGKQIFQPTERELEAMVKTIDFELNRFLNAE
jgi:hypothetical protein